MPWRIREPGRLDRGPLKKDEILAQIDAGEISSLALISKAKHAPWEAITTHPDFARAFGKYTTSAALREEPSRPTPGPSDLSPSSTAAGWPAPPAPPVHPEFGAPTPSRPSAHGYVAAPPPRAPALAKKSRLVVVGVVLASLFAGWLGLRALEASNTADREKRLLEAQRFQETQRAQRVAQEEQARQQIAARAAALPIEACKAGDAKACQEVKGYLRDNPDGPRLQDVNAALEEQARRESEVQSWDRVKSEAKECAAPRKSTACDLHRAYLSAFPGGPHATEVSRVVARVGPTLAMLERQEQARAAAEAAAAAAAEERKKRAEAAAQASSDAGGGSFCADGTPANCSGKGCCSHHGGLAGGGGGRRRNRRH